MFKILLFAMAILCTASTAFALENDTRVFKIDPAIKAEKVHFHNRYGIDLTGDMYFPKDFDKSKKYAAIAVAGPFGAVKEQSSGLYAQEMASRGFLTIAFDPSYTGESGGMPRYMQSPDINTEDFMAAVDFLSNNERVDPDRIGIIGICGWGASRLTPRPSIPGSRPRR